MRWRFERRAAALALVAAFAWAPAALAEGLTGADSHQIEVTAGAAPEAPVQERVAPEPAAPDPLFDDASDPLFADHVEFGEINPESDPFEPVNRGFFWFNQQFDRFFMSPFSRVYRFLIPEPGRRAVFRVFRNINSPPIFVNDLLQGQWRRAGVTLGRFAINTTVGIAGLFDPADRMGLDYHEADFGQTLALVGVASGPYLVLPLLGPSTVRDGFGNLVDRLFMPLTYIIGPFSPSTQLISNLVMGTGSGVTTLDANRDALDRLEESSVDFYAAMRSAYLQNRHAEVFGRIPIERGSPLFQSGETTAHAVSPPAPASAAAY